MKDRWWLLSCLESVGTRPSSLLIILCVDTLQVEARQLSTSGAAAAANLIITDNIAVSYVECG